MSVSVGVKNLFSRRGALARLRVFHFIALHVDGVVHFPSRGSSGMVLVACAEMIQITKASSYVKRHVGGPAGDLLWSRELGICFADGMLSFIGYMAATSEYCTACYKIKPVG